jgi:sec-independent protein translocase protein TatB
MFDIGFSEIVVIFGLALIVLGPDKLPKIAQTVGRWAGRARAMARQFRDQLEQEANQLKTDVDPNAPLRTTRPQQQPPQPEPPAPQPPPAEPSPAGPSPPEPSPAHAEDEPPGGPAA